MSERYKKDLTVAKNPELSRLRNKYKELQTLFNELKRKYEQTVFKQHAAEDALAESEKRYRSLYNTMSEGVALYEVVYGKDGHIDDYIVQDVNPAFERITGLKQQEIVGGKASDMNETDIPLQEEMLATCAEFGQEVSFDIRYAARNKYLQVSAFKTAPAQVATVIKDVTQARLAEEKIGHMAHYDQLTDLPNRTLFRIKLEESMERAENNKTKLALLFIDLDFFKEINDRYGHKAGDQVLVEIASRLKGLFRSSDTVARLGGDEFVVILEHLMHKKDCRRIARRIIEKINDPIHIEDAICAVGASIGIAMYPDDGKDMDTMISNADTAMYQAKESGKDTCIFYRETEGQKEEG